MNNRVFIKEWDLLFYSCLSEATKVSASINKLKCIQEEEKYSVLFEMEDVTTKSPKHQGGITASEILSMLAGAKVTLTRLEDLSTSMRRNRLLSDNLFVEQCYKLQQIRNTLHAVEEKFWNDGSSKCSQDEEYDDSDSEYEQDTDSEECSDSEEECEEESTTHKRSPPVNINRLRVNNNNLQRESYNKCLFIQ
ncbi:hypothetical protein AKO1_008744 [Acrasis kona]|uniref:Uncharacterized protein n=1 Tax=Acrasis kona TaxID=1008807 RepID=A0AAW2ZGB9_9EUKA